MNTPLVPLGKVALSMRNGLSPARGGTVEGEVLTLSAVTQGRFRPEERKPATFDVQPSPEQKTRPGMFLMCRGNGNLRLVGAGVAVPPGVAESVFPDTVIGAVLNEAVVDSRYLAHAWVTETVRSQIEAGARTTNGTYKVNQQVLEAIRVPLPPLPEQRRIAAILDEADALRRKRRESLALLDDLLRATFLDMFGDPVTNPRGWESAPAGSLIKDSQYGTAEKANTDGVGLPVLRMNNLTYEGRWLLDDLKHVEIPDSDVDKLTVRPGDLLFNRTNSPELVGKTGVWRSPDRFAFAGYLIRFRFDETRVLPDYVSGYLNSSAGKQYLFERAKASNNMSNFSASMFAEIPLRVPPLELQHRYARTAAAIELDRVMHEAALGAADSLFRSLLHRAFTRAHV